MRILAFDGVARAASVAVSEDGRILGAYSIDNGLTQSELLLPMAESLLSALKLGFSDIDVFACSVGPGSFTGVRIGVSLIKGLAFGKNAPCVAVSSIEALAENLAPLEGILLPCMDARRGQVYNAIFESDGKSVRRLTEDRAISLFDLAKELSDTKNKKIYICGDGYRVAREAIISAGIKVEGTPEILINENAISVAKVAKRKFEAGEKVSDLEISPTYLRLPQAERERLERINKQ